MAKILIVDDSALSRRILRRILEPAGHQVLEAEEGMAGIEKYSLENPDLVLLDLTMNGLNGLDTLVQLRRLDASARVIIATADIQSSTRAMVTEAGAIGFINKPFDEPVVIDAVRKALELVP